MTVKIPPSKGSEPSLKDVELKELPQDSLKLNSADTNKQRKTASREGEDDEMYTPVKQSSIKERKTAVKEAKPKKGDQSLVEGFLVDSRQHKQSVSYEIYE